MNDAFDGAFLALHSVFDSVVSKLIVTADSDTEYTLNTKTASPLPQHKGAPMSFGSVRKGKAYASFHLFPLYASPELTTSMSADLRRRMQGKSCFNFKTPPDQALLSELRELTKAGLKEFERRNWA